MRKKFLSVLICICMVCSLLPVTAMAAGDEAQWVFGANNITPVYTESGTLAEAFVAANGNSNAETPVCYVQLKTGVTASTAFTLDSGKSMVLDLNDKTITVTSNIGDIKGIDNYGNLTVQNDGTINDGTITVMNNKDDGYCSACGIINRNKLTLNNCKINASAVGTDPGGRAGGISAYVGSQTIITNCIVSASSTQSMAFGIETQGTVIINSGSFTASGSTAGTCAISSSGNATVTQMLGANTYGYYINDILQNNLGDAKTVGASGQTVEVKEIVHEHSWTYTASGATITAACEGPGVCVPDPEVETTLTIGAPALTTYGGSGDPSATLEDGLPQLFHIGNVATGVNAIKYQKALANDGWEDLNEAPTTPGTYKASITIGTATASVEYMIAKAANSFTTTPEAQTLTYTGSAQALVTAGVATGGTVQYRLGNDGTYGTAIPTATNAGTYTVYYKVVGGDNYNDVAENSVEVTISKVDPTAPTGLTGTQNNALSTVTLPDGWTWVDGTAVMNDIGEQTFKANYTDATGNYNDKSNVDVTVTVNNKTDVSGSITFADGERTYNGAGQDYEAATITGASGGSWTYTYADGGGTASLDGSSKPLTVGTYTVTATYEDSTRFGTKSATLTIAKATPTGTPTYTAITAAEKTLADAALGVGSITPEGTIQWVDENDASLDTSTVVTANTAYKWLFTPDDTTNYNTLTGSITPYVVSYSGGGGGGSYTPPTYKVESEVTKETDGGVSFSTGSAQKGDTVTITVTPDTYYQVEEVIVKDSSGKIIEVTENKDGTFSFEMPASEVIVEPVFSWDNPFTDVNEDAYYTPAVEWALKSSITNGTGTTTFSPAASCTRGQMAAFLWRAAGSPEPVGSSNPFADIFEDAYYAKAVQWAYEQGITGGTSATAFSPDAACTRAQMVTFLHRAADTQKPEGSTNPFTDVPDAYYTEAVQWAYEQSITGGTSANTFSPDAICARGQMVTFLYRFFGE